METVERTEGMNTETLADVVGRYQAETVQVQYQDVANPMRVGTVVEHRAGEFRVCWDDAEGGETWSDLRQAGWALATPGSLAMVAADRKLTAVFATAEAGTFRVSDPAGYDESLATWTQLDELHRAGRLPLVRHLEVRTVWLGADRALVGPEVRSHGRYDCAQLNLQLVRPTVGRGYRNVEDAARVAWKAAMGDRFHRRAGAGRERESDTPGDPTGVQGRGGWFYYPNGTAAAHGLRDLARVCRRRMLVVEGVDGRWYPVDVEAL